MKILKQGLGLALLAGGLAAVPGLQVEATSQPAAAPERSLVQQMRDEADGEVRVTKESATGRVGFIGVRDVEGDLLPGIAADSTVEAVGKATAYLDTYAAAFGAGDDQLTQAAVNEDQHGWTVTYTQDYQGVEVFGSMLKANFDSSGALTSVNGFAAPDLDLSVEPGITQTTAAQRAVSAVLADPPAGEDGGAANVSGVEAAATDLVVYRLGAIKGEPGEATLTYVVEVSNDRNIRDLVFVDASTGKVVNRYSMVHHGLERQLDEASIDDKGTPDPGDDEVVYDTVWQEGDPFPGALSEDQQNLVSSAGESYWMFENTFGRDSFDGSGALMRTVNNDPKISCPNANWNGVTTNYCDDVTSDDVVSHEWGHAYTEHTSGLIYQHQPGALNESYSDVWGETLDLVNGREDEGEGDLTLKRPDGLCSKHTRGAIGATINSPAVVAGPCAGAAPAAFGPIFDKVGVTTDVTVGLDADGPNTKDGCSPFTNAGDVVGRFVYVDRGSCSFATKIANAEAAGATGIVVGDNVPDRAPISMTGVSGIHGLMVTQADGTRIKSVGTVNMTIKDIDTEEKVDTFRWLIGEKSPAFGGAIRDMWNPTCYGDPGKVADAQYACDPDLADSGGVHSNSGVPNHAYALTVDGGTYNGETVAGIGLDKAANIWWRAQKSYLVPVSDFVAAADAFEASCTDLVGQPINKVVITPDAPPTPADPITVADCGSLTKALTAVGMRTQPTQCGFQPMLDKTAPPLCGPGTSAQVVYKETFEDGLAGWATDFALADGGGFHKPWTAAVGPGDQGNVAHGPAPDEGQCTGDGVTDFSSRDSIVSPQVVLPATAQSPRLTFDHYVATEAGYDGGNLKVSLNGGGFTVVPAEAYTFNKPRTLKLLAEGNTNPLQGEGAFTGTDGGKVIGSWGQSQVDLTKVGAKPGDTVRLRFDIGRDGCGGVDGWYVDNVTVVSCDKVVAPPAAAGGSVTTAKAPRRVKHRADFKVRVRVATASGGGAAGRVAIMKRGKAVAAGRLVGGRAVVTVKRNLRHGKHRLVAVYKGNASTTPSRDRFRVRVLPTYRER